MGNESVRFSFKKKKEIFELKLWLPSYSFPCLSMSDPIGLVSCSSCLLKRSFLARNRRSCCKGNYGIIRAITVTNLN